MKVFKSTYFYRTPLVAASDAPLCFNAFHLGVGAVGTGKHKNKSFPFNMVMSLKTWSFKRLKETKGMSVSKKASFQWIVLKLCIKKPFITFYSNLVLRRCSNTIGTSYHGIRKTTQRASRLPSGISICQRNKVAIFRGYFRIQSNFYD